jgi:two-component system, cell cycle response regulator
MSLPVAPLPHVMVATNDPDAEKQLIALLDEWRYPHVLVKDGTSALRFLTHPQPPAIALIDLDLDSITGLQVIHSLRHRYQQSQTWLMLIGHHASAGGVRSAAEAGADDFVLKPLDTSDLRVRLRVAERVQVLAQRVRNEAEAARFHASHDTLTGLLGRESVLKELLRETDRVQRMNSSLAYLLMDLDSFSLVNFNYGYTVGDQILKELGHRLKRHLRSYDIAARYGEDEFLIALPGCPLESHMPMAERLRQAVLERPFNIDKDGIVISASMGITQSLGRSPLVVMREVERALATAKMEGRNCIREASRSGDPNLPLSGSDSLSLRLSDNSSGKPN